MGWVNKALTETNDALAAPENTAPIYEKQKMDGCQWGGGNGISQRQTRWMDADPATLIPQLVALLSDTSERSMRGKSAACHISQTTRREDRRAGK